MTGTLYIVSCPIGNTDDITLRAISVLKTVDVIAAEDTRHTRRLMAAHQVEGADRLVSCHEHNEAGRIPGFIDMLSQGRSIALVTDAGTPSVSDPGFSLVREAAANHIAIVPVPGPSAAITALSASGMPTDAFMFAGFVPKKQGRRHERLAMLAANSATLLFYESPRRVMALLAAIFEVMGDRQAVLCREMTKPYEEFIRGSVSQILEGLEGRDALKGEVTLVVAGAAGGAAPALPVADLKKAVEAANCGSSELAKILAAVTGLPRRRLYEDILSVKNKKES
ncbi:MAG: 16S rRNA (cytidine(1402)-2'-O)-methyltransferase [Thermodesulfobacteriota bacterium]|nr:16S rRNA (cytidine(1402)-2'-O)-methyltransferase [Thermodesulfobacteriota bacterium]